MQRSQQRTILLGALLIVALVALSYLVPNVLLPAVGSIITAGMTALILYWILLLATGVIAIAVCVGFMAGRSWPVRIALFLLAVLLSAVLTSITLALGAMSDSQVQPGFFWRILAQPVLYLVCAVVAGFILLLEYGGNALRRLRGNSAAKRQ